MRSPFFNLRVFCWLLMLASLAVISEGRVSAQNPCCKPDQHFSLHIEFDGATADLGGNTSGQANPITRGAGYSLNYTLTRISGSYGGYPTLYCAFNNVVFYNQQTATGGGAIIVPSPVDAGTYPLYCSVSPGGGTTGTIEVPYQ